MPKIVDHEKYRADLLQRAFDLFAQKGFQRTSMRGIASELGVSTGKLYHYFPTKDAIFEAMVQQEAQRDVSTALDSIPEDASAAERIAALVTFTSVQEDRLTKFLLLSLDYRRERGEQATGVVRESLRTFRTGIRDQLDGDDTLAGFALSAVIGTLMHRLLDPDSVSWRDLHDQLLALADR
jgi:AcrR family transcriptional regulator